MLSDVLHSLPKGLSIIVPAYRSEASLPVLVKELGIVLPDINMPYELIIVNDCSPDNSWTDINHLVRQCQDWIVGLNLLRNSGQHAAILAGIREAKYALTITMDDDLQHNPNAIPFLIQSLTDDLDVLYAYPEKQQHGLFRDTASASVKWLMCYALQLKTVKNISAFRIFRTHIRAAFVHYDAPNPIIDALLTWGTTRFASVLVPHHPRTIGKSGYSFIKLVQHTLRSITAFSVWPLHLGSILGFVFTLFGLLILAYVFIVIMIFGRAVPGFAFLASVISIFSGVQLLCLGIIGEYLAGMYMRSFRQPTYTIQERIAGNINECSH